MFSAWHWLCIITRSTDGVRVPTWCPWWAHAASSNTPLDSAISHSHPWRVIPAWSWQHPVVNSAYQHLTPPDLEATFFSLTSFIKASFSLLKASSVLAASLAFNEATSLAFDPVKAEILNGCKEVYKEPAKYFGEKVGNKCKLVLAWKTVVLVLKTFHFLFSATEDDTAVSHY